MCVQKGQKLEQGGLCRAPSDVGSVNADRYVLKHKAIYD
jgi:hypothetical protein